MIRVLSIICVALLLSPSPSFGAKKALEPTGKGTFLFDYGSNRSILLEGDPKPNRIYVSFNEAFNDWVFVLSDIHGKFPQPTEVLVTGSVVEGDQIGAPSNQRFVFVTGGRWLASQEPRHLRLIVLGQIPSYKTVTYESASDSRIEFVNPDYKLNMKTHDFLTGR